MLRKARATGWGSLAFAVVAAAVVVTVGALRAHGDAAFNRWVGWATIAALPVAAAGVVLVLWEKIAPGIASSELHVKEIAATASQDLDRVADRLAMAVKTQWERAADAVGAGCG